MYRSMESAETLSQAISLLERIVEHWVAAGGEINRRLMIALRLSGGSFETSSRHAAATQLDLGLDAARDTDNLLERAIASLVEFRYDSATSDDKYNEHGNETGSHVIVAVNESLAWLQEIETRALHDGACGARSEHDVCAEMAKQMNIGVLAEAA